MVSRTGLQPLAEGKRVRRGWPGWLECCPPPLWASALLGPSQCPGVMRWGKAQEELITTWPPCQLGEEDSNLGVGVKPLGWPN
jgi:hypothetical protein